MMQHGSHRLLSLSSAVVVVLLLGTVSFAGPRAYQFDALEATRVSPCLDLGRRLDAALPAGAAVLGPERWWWALHQHRYVSARSMWFQWVSIAANGQQPAVFALRCQERDGLEHKTRSFLIVQPRGDNYDALIQFFRENDILGKALRLAGAWSAEVHVPVARTGPVVVTALWDSPAAYDGWRTRAIRAEFPPITQVADEPSDSLAIPSGVSKIVLTADRL
jgi:hypothetical protein